MVNFNYALLKGEKKQSVSASPFVSPPPSVGRQYTLITKIVSNPSVIVTVKANQLNSWQEIVYPASVEHTHTHTLCLTVARNTTMNELCGIKRE